MTRDLAARISADRISAVREAYRACRLCPRDCGVDRLGSDPDAQPHGPKGAFCRLGEFAPVYKELLSLGEEAAISPTWLLDLGGCSWRCVFCSEWDHVVDPWRAPAVRLDPAWFVPRLQARLEGGAKTVSFVGGDPTVSLLGVLRALAEVPFADWLPVVWNTNGQMSDAALAALDGVVACYLVDAKFGNDACAKRIAGPGAVGGRGELERTLRAAKDQGRRRPPEEQHLPAVIVRHLVMPGHLDCCTRPTLDWLAQAHPTVTVNLMTTYVPAGPALQGRAATAELGDWATLAEQQAAVTVARKVVPMLWIDGK